MFTIINVKDMKSFEVVNLMNFIVNTTKSLFQMQPNIILNRYQFIEDIRFCLDNFEPMMTLDKLCNKCYIYSDVLKLQKFSETGDAKLIDYDLTNKISEPYHLATITLVNS